MKKIFGLMSGIGFGGAEVQSLQLFNGLAGRGYQVGVLVLDEKKGELEYRLDKGIDVFHVGRKLWLDLSAIRKIKGLLSEQQPDFLVMVDSYPILYGILLKKIFRIPLQYIAVLHNTVPPDFKCAAQNRLVYAPSMNRLDKVVFVSRRQMEYWSEKYGIRQDRSMVILNGIDTERFEEFSKKKDKYRCRKELGVPVDSSVIVMNASLWARKSHEDMIEALARLRSEGMDLFLLLVGDGPRRGFLEKLCRERGVEEHVRFTGYVEDVRPWLMCADISALTSTSTETLSLAAIESMAMGKALILSDTGGASEIVDDGINGYLYPPGNIDELANRIRKIFKKGRYLRMGEMAGEKARRLFSGERMVGEYIRLLEGNE